MEDDEKLPDEVVTQDVEEATTEVETEQPAPTDEKTATEAEDGDSPEPDEQEEDERKSRSQRQRERRKAHIQELERKASEATEKLERITKAYEGQDEPKEDDFDDHIEYAAARAVWTASQRAADREKLLANDELTALQQQREQEVTANFRERETEASARLENYQQVVTNPNLTVTKAMTDVIVRADNGPDIAYHLGSNPAEAFRIANLPETEQVFELGRIASVLTLPKAKTQSEAPPPIKPVKGSANQSRDPTRMSNEEYREWRKKGGGRS